MTRKWWKESVVYQIYPKSFQDSNANGSGDIRGIINRLDYLKRLGIDIIWICPIYKSPMDDGGYDISDYYSIDPMFGDNEDFDELIRRADDLGIKILMDLVVNHTSDEHQWFKEALSDQTSKYRDYYLFKKGVNGEPPNNWRSYFGGSAWEAVPGEENMFYLHAFSRKQPDLNWENPDLREDIYEMINYWLDKGLAGFRVDAILNIKKNMVYGTLEPDAEDGLVYIGHWIMNQPGVTSLLKELNARTFEQRDSFTVAEAAVPNEDLEEYIGPDGFFSMVFDFSYTDIDVSETGDWFRPSGWTFEDMREKIVLNQLITQEKGWGALYLENHDQPRSVSKYIPKEDISDYSKKMLATLFMMLRGTPFIYQGQEIGMTNIEMNVIDQFEDIATHDQYKRALKEGVSEEDAFRLISSRSRDNSRTPMQWNDSKQAGFSESDKTWMKVNPNYTQINVDQQEGDAQSVLTFYKELIQLRKNSPYKEAIVYGEFVPELSNRTQTIVYERITARVNVLVAINYTNTVQTIRIPSDYTVCVLSNYDDRSTRLDTLLTLRPYESIIAANQ
ncbi:MAG: alpha-glucosidase [Alkalibacterium sp.]|nr:alpha-glucosidase [Alkalibacterium sp.]